MRMVKLALHWVWIAFWKAVWFIAALWLVLLVAWAGFTAWHGGARAAELPPLRVSPPRETKLVCGRFGQQLFAVPASYIPLWARFQYRVPMLGQSVGSGCYADFQSLSLALSWPGLSPVPQAYLREFSRFTGLLISISSDAPYTVSDIENVLSGYVRASNEESMEFASYHPITDLYSLTEANDFSEVGTSVFWGGARDEVEVVFICRRKYQVHEVDFCTGIFPVPELRARVEIRVAAEKIGEWKALLYVTRWFVREALKPEPSWPSG